jgi:DNA-binding MarR family transcriptional regulator
MAPMDASNIANVLGALAFRLTDEIDAELADLALDSKATAAVVHLSKYPNESIEKLRVPVELSHSGCVRLVDRLAELGLARRMTAAHDARAIEVGLTRKGRALAARVLERRAEVLQRALRSLSPAEQEQLGTLISKLYAFEVNTPASALRACRLCDYGACTRCPLRGGDGVAELAT